MYNIHKLCVSLKNQESHIENKIPYFYFEIVNKHEYHILHIKCESEWIKSIFLHYRDKRKKGSEIVT